MPGSAANSDEIVDKTFVVAHLLTGHIDLAEGATLEAINAWKPDIESDEVTPSVRRGSCVEETGKTGCVRFEQRQRDSFFSAR